MRSVITWVKANVVTAASAGVVLVCIGLLVWIDISGRAFKTEIKKVEQPLRQIEALTAQPVDVPSTDPDNPLVRIRIPITPASINQLAWIRDELDGQYVNIFDGAVQRNRDGLNYPHEPMREGLFPTRVSKDESARLNAQEQYKRALMQFTDPFDPDSSLPRLSAGRPLAIEVLEDALARMDDVAFELEEDASRDTEIPDDEYEQQQKERAQRLINLLHEHAKGIKIYANTPLPDRIPDAEDATRFTEGAVNLTEEDTPFYMGPWTRDHVTPTPVQVWEGQVDLWIQQDIVEAIALTNHESENVLTSPVKRLIGIEIEPGFVGFTSKGAVRGYRLGLATEGSLSGLGSGLGSNRRPMSPRGYNPMWRPGRHGGGAMPMPTAAADDGYGEETEDEGTDEDGDRLKENFEYSPTGRQSNSLYDVKHATVRVVIDSKRIPQFLENLARVNFMTVLMLSMVDVNEYDELRPGSEGVGLYNYGAHDAVKLELLLETLWLRRWTAGHRDAEEAARLREEFDAGLMPDEVRTLLQLKRRTPAVARDDEGEG